MGDSCENSKSRSPWAEAAAAESVPSAAQTADSILNMLSSTCVDDNPKLHQKKSSTLMIEDC